MFIAAAEWEEKRKLARDTHGHSAASFATRDDFCLIILIC
jgi:hypothetical protein